jgi:DNA-binding NarL/FixJ family response regulator
VGVALVDQEGPPRVALPVGEGLVSQRESTAHAEPMQRSPHGPSAYSGTLGTVLVADPRSATRMPLSDALRDSGFSRVLEADSLAELDAMIAGGPARELALISLEFGPAADRIIEGLAQAGWLRTLVTVPFNDSGPVIQAFGAGASGFLRGAPARLRTTMDPALDYHLSDREIEVIRLVADGRSNRWIGQNLGVSMLTVKSHLARIGRKFGTGDRAHMVAKALRAGVIR